MTRQFLLALMIGGLVASAWLSSTATGGAQAPDSGDGFTTTRLSLWNRIEGNASSHGADISADGRWISFASNATNWQSDILSTPQIYLRDRFMARTRLASVALGGAMPNGKSQSAVISGDGSTIAFQSAASNLVAGDTNGRDDIFVFDRHTGQVERVSVRSDGSQGRKDAVWPVINGNGQFVVFEARDDLLPNDTNGANDVYLKNRQSGSLVLVSIGLSGLAGEADSYLPGISANGRWVTFVSAANDLVPDDSGDYYELFIRDMREGHTTRLSVGIGGGPIQGGNCIRSSLTRDGEWIAFECDASNLTPDDQNATTDVFLVERATGIIRLISLTYSGGPTGGASVAPEISADGEWIAFPSGGENLVEGDTNNTTDVFVWEQSSGTIRRISLAPDGSENPGGSFGTAITESGEVLFDTGTALVAEDTNRTIDVYSRGEAWSFRHLYLPAIHRN